MGRGQRQAFQCYTIAFVVVMLTAVGQEWMAGYVAFSCSGDNGLLRLNIVYALTFQQFLAFHRGECSKKNFMAPHIQTTERLRSTYSHQLADQADKYTRGSHECSHCEARPWLRGPRKFGAQGMLGYHEKATIAGTAKTGAHPDQFFYLHPYLRVFVSTGCNINTKTGTNWEGDGVAPDVQVASSEEGLAVAHAHALKQVLARRWDEWSKKDYMAPYILTLGAKLKEIEDANNCLNVLTNIARRWLHVAC
ncbi:Aste57867_10621 [Aphanomyces stellatus]|uniref:Aste57867_10621 protein n=1 Tax=Aphanomyces stellatus TaxID=120398 RepID=A0A485KRA4_9STRA|nr:hypothetical protein As57867_010581 [Aphanomyces stellatus]VFT87493.1 Aste57867_10621 [Aphanomyces stellatus]